jgi:hypothetical protein
MSPSAQKIARIRVRSAYINTPEFLDRVEGDNFLEKIIPVITLYL